MAFPGAGAWQRGLRHRIRSTNNHLFLLGCVGGAQRRTAAAIRGDNPTFFHRPLGTVTHSTYFSSRKHAGTCLLSSCSDREPQGPASSTVVPASYCMCVCEAHTHAKRERERERERASGRKAPPIPLYQKLPIVGTQSKVLPLRLLTTRTTFHFGTRFRCDEEVYIQWKERGFCLQ